MLWLIVTAKISTKAFLRAFGETTKTFQAILLDPKIFQTCKMKKEKINFQINEDRRKVINFKEFITRFFL